MDKTLISFDELSRSTSGSALARQNFLWQFLTEGSTVYPAPMCVVIDAPYKGAGTAMRMSFPNGAPLPRDEAKQLQTWAFMKAIFPSFDNDCVTRCYHFLCMRDRNDKKTNYFPILLVEEVNRGLANGRSASLARMSEDHLLRPCEPEERIVFASRYLQEVEQANAKWLDTLEE